MPWRNVAFGGVAWLALAGAAGAGALGLIELLFLLAPLVVVPLGMRLLPESPLLRAAGLLQPWAASAAAGSFFVPAGTWGAALSLPWAGVTALIGLEGLVRLRGTFRRGFAAFLDTAAMLFLPVGGLWLVVSRSGRADLAAGFPEPIVLLTAVHFHFTTFAGPLLAARVGARAAGLGIVLATPLLATGFLYSRELKLGAAHALALAFAAVAVQEVRAVPRTRDSWTRWLTVISAASVLAGMVLAAVFEVGAFTRAGWLSIPQMARTHGFLNGLGFAAGGLLARALDENDGLFRQGNLN